jgi:hypothetical protein
MLDHDGLMEVMDAVAVIDPKHLAYEIAPAVLELCCSTTEPEIVDAPRNFRVAKGDPTGTIRVWQPATGELLQQKLHDSCETGLMLRSRSGVRSSTVIVSGIIILTVVRSAEAARQTEGVAFVAIISRLIIRHPIIVGITDITHGSTEHRVVHERSPFRVSERYRSADRHHDEPFVALSDTSHQQGCFQGGSLLKRWCETSLAERAVA